MSVAGTLDETEYSVTNTGRPLEIFADGDEPCERGRRCESLVMAEILGNQTYRANPVQRT